MSKIDASGIVAIAALAGAGFIVWHLYRAGPGLLSGDNELTKTATDASGQRTTAYEGRGVAGTIGAAANKASGGVLASVGAWLGGKVYDLTHSDPTDQASATGSDAPAQAGADTPASTTRWVTAGIASNDPMDNPSFTDISGMPAFNF